MDLIKIPIFTYAQIKYQIKTNLNLNKNNELALKVLTLISTVLALIVILPVIILLIVYKQIINLILWLTYGSKYKGLLNGIDSICAREKKSVVNLLNFVEYSGTPEELLEGLRRRIQEISDKKSQEKLFFVRKSFFGLNYYLRHEFKSSEIVRLMQKMDIKEFDKKTLQAVLQIEDQLPMPCNDTGLLEIAVGQQPVTCEPYTTKTTYPVNVRIHHSLGDGISIFTCFCSQLNGKDLPETKVTFMDQVNDKLSEMKLATATTEIKSDFTRLQDKNILQTYDLLEDKHFVWYSEFNSEILSKIKKIRRFHNTSFASVINACLATTLYEYYQKRTDDIPEKIKCGVVYLPKPVNIEYGKASMGLRNMFVAVALDFPIKLKDKVHPNPVVARLQMLQQEHLKVMNSIEIQWSYYLGQYLCSLLPIFVTNFLFKYVGLTVGVSSLPGGQQFSYFGEEGYVKDFLPFPPNSTGTGIHTAIISYGGNMKMTVTVDKAVIPKSADAEWLLARTLEHINEMAEACKV